MEVIAFLIVLEITGLLAIPLARAAAGSLWDRGYFLGRPIGIIVVSLAAWVCSLAGLVPFPASAGIGLLLLGFLGVFSAWRYRDLEPDRGMLLQEAIFLSAFLLAALYLAQKPEIYFEYSEDFMDSAILQSILHTGPIPFVNPWFAGFNLNYYYFGHLASAVLVALSGVKASVGFNLAVAAVFAMGVQAAFGIGLDLTGKRLYGFVSVLLIAIAGLPAGFVQLLSYLGGTDLLGFHTFVGSPAAWVLSFDFNAGSWAIPGTIILYPFFTFLQGDLHSHFMAVPFLLVLIGLCLALTRKYSPLTLFAAAVVTVFLTGVFAWALPACLVLIAWSLRARMTEKVFFSLIAIACLLIAAAVIAGAAGIVLPGHGTAVTGFLLVFSTFVFISVAFLADSHRFTRRDIPLIAIVAAVGIAAFVTQFLLPILVLLAFPFLRRAWYGEDYPALLAGIALLLIIITELFFIRDGFAPPFERINTVMKFYLLAWIFWGAAAAYFLCRMKNRALVAAAAVLIALACIHPALSLVSMPGAGYMGTTEKPTLDGAAWLAEQKPDEYAALVWLGAAAHNGDVVLEAPGEAYSYSSRVSPFTGLPTVLGWGSHVRVLKAWGKIDVRRADIDTMYRTCNPDLFAEYHVRYVFAGETERAKYGSALDDLARCPALEPVFTSGNTTLYRVV